MKPLLSVHHLLPPLTLTVWLVSPLMSGLHTDLCDHNKLTAGLAASQNCIFDNLKLLVRQNQIQPQDLIGKYPLWLNS